MFSKLRILNLAGPTPMKRGRTEVRAEMAGEILDRARAAKAVGLTEKGMCYGPDTKHALEEVRQAAAPLTEFDPFQRLTTRSEAMAFWINLYNAMVIHGALTFRVKHAMTEVPRFFQRTAYRVGGLVYNLNVIEHGILRENRGHPMRLIVAQLMPGDRRRRLVLRPMDRRIHFALNCGAVSCPPIRHYTAEHIEEELDLAAQSFVSGGGVRLDPTTGEVVLSRILLWYARDFGWTKRKQLDAVIAYMDEPQRAAARAADRRKMRYADYDWSFA